MVTTSIDICCEKPQQKVAEDQKIKPIFMRWVILFLFCINSGNKSFQWISIPASTNKVTYYYGVENFVINTTSIIFMVSFLVLSWPACYIIEHIGLRKAVLIGSFGTAFGCILKCFSCYEDGIYMLFAGQIIVSLSEQFIFSVPSRLASVWFPDHQVSFAVAMSVLGQHLGVALGFAVPEYLLNNTETKEQISWGLYYLFVGSSVLSIASFILDFLLFYEAPEYAPGAARLKQIASEKEAKLLKTDFVTEMRNLTRQFKNMIVDKHFLLLSTSYGITVGLGYAISTVLNQMLEPLWPGEDILVGKTGFIIIISGAIATPIWGHVLDKTRRYLGMNLFLTIATIVALVLFGYAVSGTESKMAVYITAALFGFFQTGFIVAGLELAVELTYPSPELATSSLMNVMPQIYGTVFVFVASYIVDNYGAIATNAFYIGAMSIALIMLMNIKETLRRQDAVIEKKPEIGYS